MGVNEEKTGRKKGSFKEVSTQKKAKIFAVEVFVCWDFLNDLNNVGD